MNTAVEKGVARPKPEKTTVQIGVRVDEDWLGEIDLLATEMAGNYPGSKPTRSEALRVALRKGLDVVAAERKKPKAKRS